MDAIDGRPRDVALRPSDDAPNDSCEMRSQLPDALRVPHTRRDVSDGDASDGYRCTRRVVAPYIVTLLPRLLLPAPRCFSPCRRLSICRSANSNQEWGSNKICRCRRHHCYRRRRDRRNDDSYHAGYRHDHRYATADRRSDGQETQTCQKERGRLHFRHRSSESFCSQSQLIRQTSLQSLMRRSLAWPLCLTAVLFLPVICRTSTVNGRAAQLKQDR